MSQNPFAQLLAPESFRAQPWKNGRGTTHEIAAEPAGLEPGDAGLLWRLSTAPVLIPGPFSEFPGFLRLLTLVEGKELRLAFAGREASLRRGDVYAFRGDEPVAALLPAGPVRDIGLLYRGDQVKAEMSVLEFKGGVRSFAFRRRMVFFCAVTGDVAVSVFPGGGEFRLKGGNALRVETMGTEKVLVCEPKAPFSSLVAVELDW